MATSTFERKIEIKTPESIRRLATILSNDTKARPISVAPFSKKDRDKVEMLLSRLATRSKS